jgi:hypothetical protein
MIRMMEWGWTEHVTHVEHEKSIQNFLRKSGRKSIFVEPDVEGG